MSDDRPGLHQSTCPNTCQISVLEAVTNEVEKPPVTCVYFITPDPSLEDLAGRLNSFSTNSSNSFFRKSKKMNMTRWAVPRNFKFLDVPDWMKTTSINEAMNRIGISMTLDELRRYTAFEATRRNAAKKLVPKLKPASSE